MGEKAGLDFPPREEGDEHEEKPRPENDSGFSEMSHEEEQHHERESAASHEQANRDDGLGFECLVRLGCHSRRHEPGDDVFEFANNEHSRPGGIIKPSSGELQSSINSKTPQT